MKPWKKQFLECLLTKARLSQICNLEEKFFVLHVNQMRCNLINTLVIYIGWHKNFVYILRNNLSGNHHFIIRRKVKYTKKKEMQITFCIECCIERRIWYLFCLILYCKIRLVLQKQIFALAFIYFLFYESLIHCFLFTFAFANIFCKQLLQWRGK